MTAPEASVIARTDPSRCFWLRSEAALADDLLSLREAAAASGLSASHLRLLARTGRLKAQKLGRDWFTTEAAVAAYIADEAFRANHPRKRRRST